MATLGPVTVRTAASRSDRFIFWRTQVRLYLFLSHLSVFAFGLLFNDQPQTQSRGFKCVKNGGCYKHHLLNPQFYISRSAKIDPSEVLCISTNFQVLRAPVSWLKPFFSHFSTFFVYFKAFSVISRLKSLKNVWKQKGWKTAKKKVLTRFRVGAALESWLKYTTQRAVRKYVQKGSKISKKVDNDI